MHLEVDKKTIQQITSRYETYKDDIWTWPHWPQKIKESIREQKEISVIGYGSLLKKESLNQTSKDFVVKGPVYGYGLKRVFNFVLDEQGYTRYTRSSLSENEAALNVIKTTDPLHCINGLEIAIPESGIKAFIEREGGYHITPVPLYNAHTNEVYQGYTLILDERSAAFGKHIRKTNLFPNESYLEICLSGAASLGKKFLNEWLASTYLADEQTLVQESQVYQNMI